MLRLCGNIPYIVINTFPSFMVADAIAGGEGRAEHCSENDVKLGERLESKLDTGLALGSSLETLMTI